MLTKKNVTVWLAAIPYFIGVTINEIHLSFDGYIEGRGTVHVGPTRHVGNHWVLLEVVTPMDSCHILSFCLIGISWYSIIVDQIVFWAPEFMGRYWTYCPPDSSRSTGKTHPFLIFEYPKNGLHHGPSCPKNLCGARNEIYSKKNIKVTFLIEFCSDLDQLVWVGRKKWEVGLLVLFGLLSDLVDAIPNMLSWIPRASHRVVARLLIFSLGRPSEWDDSHCWQYMIPGLVI